MNEVTVKFHFVSGVCWTVILPQDEWNELNSLLKKDWSKTFMTNSDFGIDFGHVTHYEIVK